MTLEELHGIVLNSLEYGLYFVDIERRIHMWNAKATEITGFSPSEVVGRFCYDNILCHIDENAVPLCLTNCPVHYTIDDGISREAKVFLRHKTGRRIAVRIRSSPVFLDEALIGVVETFDQPLSETYSGDLVDSLTKLIMTDKLTGLYNRRYGETILGQKIREVRSSGLSSGLIFLDLDNFSSYNNRYGHDVGDKLLETMAKNVLSRVRGEDLFCRWGGEEFVGSFDLAYPAEITAISEKIRATVEGTRVAYGEEILSMTASLGATVIERTDTLETAISRVDSLMYQSKQHGKNRVTVG